MVEETARQLAEILWSEGLSEIALETGEETLRMRRRRLRPQSPPPPPALPPAGEEAPGGESLEELAAVPVTSACVGLVHLTDPLGASLAEAGQEVREGQVLALLERMGLNHEVLAPRDGRILEILIQDGEPVEYGQALLILQTGA